VFDCTAILSNVREIAKVNSRRLESSQDKIAKRQRLDPIGRHLYSVPSALRHLCFARLPPQFQAYGGNSRRCLAVSSVVWSGIDRRESSH